MKTKNAKKPMDRYREYQDAIKQQEAVAKLQRYIAQHDEVQRKDAEKVIGKNAIEISNLKAQIEKLNMELDNAHKTIIKYSQDYDDLQLKIAQVAQLQRKVIEVEDELDSSKEEVADLKEKLEKSDRANDVKNLYIADLEERLQNYANITPEDAEDIPEVDIPDRDADKEADIILHVYIEDKLDEWLTNGNAREDFHLEPWEYDVLWDRAHGIMDTDETMYIDYYKAV